MWVVPDQFKVRIGGNLYQNVPNLVVYKEENLFRLERSVSDGILGVDFDIYNGQGKKVATIRHSIVVSGDEQNYEITTGHAEYSIKELSTDRIITTIKRRDVSEADLDVSVELYTKDGFLFNATPTLTNIGGLKVYGNIISNRPYGINIPGDGSVSIG